MGRAPCCEKVGLKRGPWTPEEDQKLIAYINENGHGSWRALPKRAGLLRCGKSCRLRWTNYLRPDIKRGDFSLSEEQSIIQLHALLGNRWSAIASHLPKRTDNEIKNYWNTHLKKKLMKMGLDPVTHKSKVDNTLMSNNAIPEETADMDKKESNVKDKIDSSDGGVRSKIFMLASNSAPSGSSITNHMAQWESARLEAEARLAQESQLRARGLWSRCLASPNPLNVAPLSAYSPWSGAKTFRSSTNNGSVCADACKALNAVELFHALHNWEKSLQGQAGMMWPEAWQLRNLHLPLPEAQAESSSCSSPCSDANTNAAAATTTIRSPSINAAANGMDHSSPTSTLCSFDSFSLKQKGMQPPFAGVSLPGLHTRKLSWNDALSASLAKPPMPPRYSQQGVNCKLGEDSSTFSSLMQDAIMSVDAMASAFTCAQEEGADKSKAAPVIDDDVSCAKVEEFSCAKVEEFSCDKLSFMVGDLNSPEEEKNDNLHATYEAGTTMDNEESMDSALIGGEEFANKEEPDSKLSGLILPSDTNLQVGDVRDEFKECKDNKTGMIKDCDILDAHDDQNASTGAELMNAEMFKDLPKLKSEASTISHLSSLPALLSDDISDYWSSIMLKEPSLQQVEMTF